MTDDHGSFMRAGALPDLERPPRDEVRGTVVILGGSNERSADFGFLTDQLSLAGFRVAVFDDVSIEPEAARVGAERLLQDARQQRPRLLIGSDIGATLAADIAARTTGGLDAVVLAGIVTAASRTPLPVGLALPAARSVLAPALVFHGDADTVTDVADAVSWATQLVFGALRLVQHGDHGVLTGESRRTVAAAILLFLERQRAGEPVLSDGFAPSPGRDA